jgi:RING-variant domain
MRHRRLLSRHVDASSTHLAKGGHQPTRAAGVTRVACLGITAALRTPVAPSNSSHSLSCAEASQSNLTANSSRHRAPSVELSGDVKARTTLCGCISDMECASTGAPVSAHNAAAQECWICLGTAKGALTQPCRCPGFAHRACLARWQLQKAGTRCEPSWARRPMSQPCASQWVTHAALTETAPHR